MDKGTLVFYSIPILLFWIIWIIDKAIDGLDRLSRDISELKDVFTNPHGEVNELLSDIKTALDSIEERMPEKEEETY